MAYNSHKNECLISTLQEVATLVGEKKTADGHEVGLGLTLHHDLLMKQAQDIHDGIFRVVVMGAFTTGKSTLINALVGKRILPESALLSTAILTFIQYGEDKDCVGVHFKDKTDESGNYVAGRVEKISHEDFFKEYRYTDDNSEFIEIGQVEPPIEQEYLSSPFKWLALPLLVTVLAYKLCLPSIAKDKYRQIEKLVSAVNDEMREKGVEITT